MLFKKTLKVASATALWMVALLGANSAMAQDTYSLETFGALTPPATMHTVAGAFEGKVVVDEFLRYDLANVSGDTSVFVRVTPVGMAFGAAPRVHFDAVDTQTPPEAVPDTSNRTMELGASGGYRYELDTATPRVTHIRVSMTNAMVSGATAGMVQVSVYSTERNAHFGQGDALAELGMTDAMFEVGPSVSVVAAMGSPFAHTATAETRFRELEGGPGKYPMGGFNVVINTMHLTPAGMSIRDAARAADNTATPALAAIEPDGDGAFTSAQEAMIRERLFGVVGISGHNSRSRFYGDGGFAFVSGPMDSSGFELNNAYTCDGTAKPAGAIVSYPGMEVGEDDAPANVNEVVGRLAIDPWYLCANIPAGDDAPEIPEGSYGMDVTIVPTAEDQPFPAVGMTTVATVAEIDHDGTTVQVPYLTTYESYNQRIVIVNRTKVDVGYSIAFQTEEGVTATPTMMAEGMVKGGTTTVMKATDLVTLEGGTRASAEIVLLAAAHSVDVATTIVHKVSGATDTVVLESR